MLEPPLHAGLGRWSATTAYPVAAIITFLALFLGVTSYAPERRFIDLQVGDSIPSCLWVGSDATVLELSASGANRLGRTPMELGQLRDSLTRIFGGRPDKLAFIRASSGRTYGDMVRAADLLRAAGARVLILGAPTRNDVCRTDVYTVKRVPRAWLRRLHVP